MSLKKNSHESKEVAGIGMSAIKPEGWDRTNMEIFKDAIYNPKTGEILTRTPHSWLQVFIFYVFFFSFLAGFWILCMFLFFQTLPNPEDGPRWTLDSSRIGVNPGVGLIPRNNLEKIDSTIIMLKAADTNIGPSGRQGEGELNADYAVRIDGFLAKYKNTTKENDGTKYKQFDVSQLEECSQFPYGYVSVSGAPVAPCIFLKVNNIWGWKPEPITCSLGGMITKVDSCPNSLIEHLASQEAKKAGQQNIWVDCGGRYPADREALADGGLTYYPPSRAIPIDSFPYEGKHRSGSNSPIVAVKVSPRVIGQMIHIECRAYFKGVKFDTKTKTGLLQFEVIVKERI